MHIRCECGHHCCKNCKCSVNPDPVRYGTVCPCKLCESSEIECDPQSYMDPRMYNMKFESYWDKLTPEEKQKLKQKYNK